VSGFDPLAPSKPYAFKKPLQVAAVVVAGAVALLTGLSVIGLLTRESEGDVRSLIAEHLAKGATVDEIHAFLDSRHIKHDSTTTAPARSDPVLTDAGYTGNVRFVLATMNATSHWITIGESDFFIYFILDESDRLQDYVVSRQTILPQGVHSA
jgi:hypothetical protein